MSEDTSIVIEWLAFISTNIDRFQEMRIHQSLWLQAKINS